MKRTICAVLIICFIFTAASCAERKDPNAPADAIDTTAAVTEAETDVIETLADANFEGYSFSTLTKSAAIAWGQVSFDAAELNGEIINDTVYARNSAIEERYNITIENAELDDVAGTTKKLVAAGSDEYDFISDYVKVIMQSAVNGDYYNLNNVASIDFTRPWWNYECTEELAVGGKLFDAFNSMSTQLLDLLYCVYFNNDIVENFSLQSPYELVRAGKWTMDAFYEMCTMVADDTDGDGKMTKADRFGNVTGIGSFNGWANAANQPHIKYDNDGNIILNYGTEAAIAAAEKIASIINADFSVYLNDSPWGSDVFAQGSALFREGTLNTFAGLREYDAEIGVLPAPKFDEAQEKYRAMMSNCSLGVTIPIISEDPERTGVIVEAMGAYSLGALNEAFYEITLQGKYTRDEESVEMIDIIKSSQVVDLGVINENAWGTIITSWLSSIRKSGAENLASLAESNQAKFDGILLEIIEAYDELA